MELSPNTDLMRKNFSIVLKNTFSILSIWNCKEVEKLHQVSYTIYTLNTDEFTLNRLSICVAMQFSSANA